MSPVGPAGPVGLAGPGPGRSVKERLRAGEQLVGALVRMPCEDLVEMLAASGVDVVLVDCEHGPADVTALRQHIAVAQLHGASVLVRIGAGEGALALRALDQGAEGVVAPHVDTAEDARALVRAAHYPPLGARGFATYPRAGGFGVVPAAEHAARARAATLVLAMLESPAAVRDAAAVLAVPGIDGYLVGTADLGASRTDDDPPVGELLARVRAAAPPGAVRTDLVSSPAEARAALDDGAQLVLYNVAQLLMGVFAGLVPVRS